MYDKNKLIKNSLTFTTTREVGSRKLNMYCVDILWIYYGLYMYCVNVAVAALMIFNGKNNMFTETNEMALKKLF